MASEVSADHDVLATARWRPGPSCAGTTSFNVPPRLRPHVQFGRCAAPRGGAIRALGRPGGAHARPAIHAGHGLEVRRERPVVVEERASARARRRRSGARPLPASTRTSGGAQVDRLRGDHRLDRDQVRRAARASRRASPRCAAPSSRGPRRPPTPAGKSRHAGLARWRMSLASAVSGFCTVAKPDCCGPWRVSCSGSPEAAGDSSLMQRSTASVGDLRDGEAQRSRSAMREPRHVEVAGRQQPVAVDVDERAVGGGVELDLDMIDRARERVVRGAVHLRDAAERQRVLDPPRGVRLQERAAVERFAISRAAASAWPGAGRAACARGSNGERFARKPSQESAMTASSECERAREIGQDEAGVAHRHGIRADEREAVLGGERDGREPGRRERLRAGDALAVRPGPRLRPSARARCATSAAGRRRRSSPRRGTCGHRPRCSARRRAPGRRRPRCRSRPAPCRRRARTSRRARGRRGSAGPTPTARARTACIW